MLNTTIATEVWLKRFDLPPDQKTEPWRELHKTPTLGSSKAGGAAKPVAVSEGHGTARARAVERVRIRQWLAGLTNI